jgi:SusD family.
MFELGGQGSGNKEIIFAVPTRRSDSNSWNDWQATVCPSDFGYGKWEGTSGYKASTASWAFYDSFEENDLRRTYLLGEYYTKKGEYVPRNDKRMERGPIPCKFGPVPNYNGAVEKQDIIIYRYADAILAKAECLYMKPESTDADKQSSLSYINQIRKRAGLNELAFEDIDTKDEFIDRLILERKHEFWCENGQVRADVIRLGRWGGPEHTQLYPLPEAVIIDGRGKVEQNLGF